MTNVDLTFKNSPTILIVDDEELMRDVTSIMLEEHGAKVMVAVDGQEAIDIVSERGDEIDMVFMDFSMPRKNGYEAYLEIKAIKPHIGVLMVSGLKVTPEIKKLEESGEVCFLSKPFHEEDLISAFKTIQKKCGV